MEILELGGQWTVQEQGKEEKIPATVPGDVHADLLRAGKTPDLFYRDNENDVQWVGESDWLYSRMFDVPADLLEHERVLLRCEGLDALATVRVNGKEIGTTNNVYRTWEFEVKDLLRAEENHIQIDFPSMIQYSLKKHAECPLPSFQIKRLKQEPGRVEWLKKLSSGPRGWVRGGVGSGGDNGLKAVACGIRRPIRIVAFNTARLENVGIAQDHSHEGVVGLAVHVSAEKLGDELLSTHVQVLRNKQVVAQGNGTLQDGNCIVELAISKPELWWPNNMGTQPLYDVAIELMDAKEEILDTATKRIGLRTLHLDRHPDQWGESFQFVVNGVPFFAKGANWLEGDVFLTRMTGDRYRRLVEDAVAANMNMFRNLTGFICEDAFYEACDELGICIWQEFGVATSPFYDELFLANVTAEARENIQRLRHHPSIALWCGNNEVEMFDGLLGESWSETSMSWRDYSHVHDKLLPDLVRELDPERDYWPSSPHSSCGDRADANNPTSGDAHLWYEVWHGKKPIELYRTNEHRFVSEFGVQSFPEPKTVNGYTIPEDRNITSWVIEHHQRSYRGNTEIMQYILDWFRLPEGFENCLWVSQILQGEAIKYGCEHWRRSMPRGMGTLWWSFNDVWPGQTWSCVDYHGRWKALLYMARRFFAPLLVSGLEDRDKGTVEIHVTSDLMTSAEGTVRWRVTDLSGAELANGGTPIKILPRINQKAETLQLAKLITEHGQRNLLVWLELVVNGKVASNNLVLFALPKYLELNREPGITSSIEEQPDGSFTVTLKARQPALWCWLELEGVDAALSDNFVHLRPDAPVTITVRPERRLTAQTFHEQLIVRSLVDTYQPSHLSKAAVAQEQ